MRIAIFSILDSIAYLLAQAGRGAHSINVVSTVQALLNQVSRARANIQDAGFR